ncbi:MAG: NADH:flavin oxidoreductase/NADH oxidase [Propionibacteriaceae bacterium]|jgi:2,4-dienoyl-CoA reductase-like NADH-dependent reductase (Old Yellow Enzyme family)|nr:NADH:flavin oxidoreductase/NADH oxidase [Propionibacteriaceae bacterium]
MATLFDPFMLRGLTIRNRMFLPPMCTYSCQERDGVPNDWHLVHYGSRAVGGFGLIMAEATGITPEGRITPYDCGLWNDTQRDAWKRVINFVHAYGAAIGVQLNHSGRKGSSAAKAASVPESEGGWQTMAPSPIAFPGYDTPREMNKDDIAAVVTAFAAAAERAVAAGFDAVELHAAHGYLLFEFLSPLTNLRTDEYGGDFEGRSRLLIEVVDAVRAVLPETMPLLVRLSATEWLDEGWSVRESVQLATLLKEHGVDMMDVSSGGNVPATIDTQPGYQVWLARHVRRSGLPVIAVGLITSPKQAARIMDEGNIDAIAIGRAAIRRPYWPLWAGYKLDKQPEEMPYPLAYERGAFVPKQKQDSEGK